MANTLDISLCDSSLTSISRSCHLHTSPVSCVASGGYILEPAAGYRGADARGLPYIRNEQKPKLTNGLSVLSPLFLKAFGRTWKPLLVNLIILLRYTLWSFTEILSFIMFSCTSSTYTINFEINYLAVLLCLLWSVREEILIKDLSSGFSNKTKYVMASEISMEAQWHYQFTAPPIVAKTKL